MAEINNYSFIRFIPIASTVTGRDFPRVYLRDDCYYMPCIQSGETTAIYINSVLTTSGTITAKLQKADLTEIPITTQTIYKVTIEGGYQLTLSFVCPTITRGFYRIILMVNGSDVYKSNQLESKMLGFESSTSILKYRDSAPLFGNNYDLVPEFYNQIRLGITEIDGGVDYNIDQYRSASGLFRRNYNSEPEKWKKFETYYFDDKAHSAMEVALQHNEIYINNEQIVFKTGYKPNYSLRDSMTKGDFEMYIQKYNSEKKSNSGLVSGIYGNEIQSDTFTKNNCEAGNGTTVIYTVPANTYFSSNSISEANSLALSDIALNGQEYANANGICEGLTLLSYTFTDGLVPVDFDQSYGDYDIYGGDKLAIQYIAGSTFCGILIPDVIVSVTVGLTYKCTFDLTILTSSNPAGSMLIIGYTSGGVYFTPVVGANTVLLTVPPTITSPYRFALLFNNAEYVVIDNIKLVEVL